MAKKQKLVEEEDDVEQTPEERPSKKAKVKPSRGNVGKPHKRGDQRPMSVGGIVDKGVTTQRVWEKNAPWNKVDKAGPSRFEHARVAKR